MKRGVLTFLVVVLGAGLGCGGEPPAPAEPPPAPAPPPAPPPEPAASASAAPSAAPVDEPKRSSGRPPVIVSDPVQVTQTFGSTPAAKVEVGGPNVAVFRIPENALSQGVNITFKIDTRGKANGAPIGKIFHIIPVIPPATTASTVDSTGAPFEIHLNAGKQKANLTVGSIGVDDKGREKITWTVIAPKRVDESTGMAHFEVTRFADSFVHLTAKAPTEGAK